MKIRHHTTTDRFYLMNLHLWGEKSFVYELVISECVCMFVSLVASLFAFVCVCGCACVCMCLYECLGAGLFLFVCVYACARDFFLCKKTIKRIYIFSHACAMRTVS